MRRLSVITSSLALLLALPLAASATDFGSSFSVSGSVAGGNMLNAVGNTTNSTVNLIMGPGMYVVMAIGALLALYGYGRGNKETLVTGIVLFVLAAVLRGVWGLWG